MHITGKLLQIGTACRIISVEILLTAAYENHIWNDYGKPFSHLIHNFRYLQLFADICNCFRDIFNSITDICNSISDIYNSMGFTDIFN